MTHKIITLFKKLFLIEKNIFRKLFFNILIKKLLLILKKLLLKSKRNVKKNIYWKNYKKL